MHATSVAVAIIALNAASALAGPTSNNFYRRTTPDGAAPAVKADAAGGAGGAIPTTTVYYPPKATPCKAGETPNATKGASHKHKHKSKAEAAHHGTGAEPDNKAAAVQPRAPAPTNAPRSTGTDEEGSDKPKQHKKGPHTQTDKDSNGTPTLVRVFVPEKTHRCYAPTGDDASSHGSASGSNKVEARTDEHGTSSGTTPTTTITRHHSATRGADHRFTPVPVTEAHTVVVVYEPGTGDQGTKDAKKSVASDPTSGTKDAKKSVASDPTSGTKVTRAVRLLERYFGDLDELD